MPINQEQTLVFMLTLKEGDIVKSCLLCQLIYCQNKFPGLSPSEIAHTLWKVSFRTSLAF